jgi:hypothetical protein
MDCLIYGRATADVVDHNNPALDEAHWFSMEPSPTG